MTQVRYCTISTTFQFIWMFIHGISNALSLSVFRTNFCYHSQQKITKSSLLYVNAWISHCPLIPRTNQAQQLQLQRQQHQNQHRITFTKSKMSSLLSSSSTKEDLPKVIIIAGPTASGKSDVAAIICDAMNGIIISADSVQVYDKVQIGANKPSAEELQRTPHILVNVIPAKGSDNNNQNTTTSVYNTAEWRRDALFSIEQLVATGTKSYSNIIVERDNLSQQTIDDDQKRQKDILISIEAAKQVKSNRIKSVDTTTSTDTTESYIPVVVGGTMMYLQWLVHGRPDAIRPTETALQEAKQIIEQNYQLSNDWDAATKFVSDQGSIFTQQVQKLSIYDWYRLRRVLEVALTVKELPNHEMTLQLDDIYSGIREGGLSSFGYDVRCFFLCPDDRMKHTKVVDSRCEAMICRGLLRETTDLVLANEMPDMATKAIGYRQCIDYLQRDHPIDNDSDSFMEFLAKFTAATRQYSKRQMQWFRRDSEFMFIGVPLDLPKNERITHVANQVMQYVTLSKEEYEIELHSPSSESQLVRSRNAEQAKAMRTYQLQKQVLLENSMELQNAIIEADECTKRFQKRKRICVRANIDDNDIILNNDTKKNDREHPDVCTTTSPQVDLTSP